MKAFILDQYGKKSGLRLGEMPAPELRDDEVLVQVHAAGVNLLDAKIKSGEFKLILPYRLPTALGHDVAGIVARESASLGLGMAWMMQQMLGRFVLAPNLRKIGRAHV